MARSNSQGRPPGLIQYVLTVLVFWSWMLLLARLPPSSQSLALFPWASTLLHGPLDICLDMLPAAFLPPVQKRDAQHMFLSRALTRDPRSRVQLPRCWQKLQQHRGHKANGSTTRPIMQEFERKPMTICEVNQVNQ